LSHSGLKNLALADWPLSGNHYDSFGSGHAGPLFKFAAGKRSLQFRFPEAAIRHRVLATQSGRGSLGEADVQDLKGNLHLLEVEHPKVAMLLVIRLNVVFDFIPIEV